MQDDMPKQMNIGMEIVKPTPRNSVWSFMTRYSQKKDAGEWATMSAGKLVFPK